MKRVAIIGAGFTGLTAAYRLAQHGCDVVVYEKGSDIGGLAGGFSMQGMSLEKAYHHLFRTDTDILSLVDELGLHDELQWFESKVGMVVKNKGAKELEFEILPFNGVKDLLMYKPLPSLDRIRAGAVLFFLQKYNGWKSLISKTAYGWMEKWSGPRVMDTIWGPLLKGKFADYAKKVSMAWLWARIHIRANSRKSIFEKELLAYPQGGFHLIAATLAEKTAELLNKRVEDIIKLSSFIERISFDDNAQTIIVDGKSETFDAILSTIPEKAFAQLVFKTEPAQIISKREQIEYLSAVVLTFSSTQSLSQYYWHNIIDKESPFLVFLQHTNLVPKEWYKGKHVYYIGVYVPQNHPYMVSAEYTKEGIQKEWFTYLKKLFPAFDETQISDINLFKFSHAQHVVDLDYSKKIPPYNMEFPHCYLANFSQIFPEDRGTNYAVREGKKIADLIIKELVQ